MEKKSPLIVFTQYSPYLVVDMDYIVNSKGEKIKLSPVSSLCRCGESKIKPFCDGTHAQIGFSGAKAADCLPSKLKDYKGKEITVHFNLGICSHKGECYKNLPEVFDFDRKPWIIADNASVEKIIETIKKCPSGALSYTLGITRHKDWGQEEEIIAGHNGPFEFKGNIILKDDQNSYEQLESTEHYCLCRCGAAKNKPFCDGAHQDIKFKAE